jgi:hypothetical protein
MRRDNPYKDQFTQATLNFWPKYFDQAVARLNFVRDNGCNTVVLTGEIEPQQNQQFLVAFGQMLRAMRNPFLNVEMQTTGVEINPVVLQFIRDQARVNTVSLSVMALDSILSKEYRCGPAMSISFFCGTVLDAGMNLRLSVNCTDMFNSIEPEDILDQCRELGAQQVTFRKLYSAITQTPQVKWIAEHAMDAARYDALCGYVFTHGERLRVLEYGKVAYALKGMSVVIDDDCMGEHGDYAQDLKYLILRPDCKLYSSWNDPASLVF